MQPRHYDMYAMFSENAFLAGDVEGYWAHTRLQLKFSGGLHSFSFRRGRCFSYLALPTIRLQEIAPHRDSRDFSAMQLRTFRRQQLDYTHLK